jgi:hypothetical protein
VRPERSYDQADADQHTEALERADYVADRIAHLLPSMTRLVDHRLVAVDRHELVVQVLLLAEQVPDATSLRRVDVPPVAVGLSGPVAF